MKFNSPEQEQTRATIEKLATEAWSASQKNETNEAEKLYRQAIEMAASIADPASEAICHIYLGIIKQKQEALDEAASEFEAAARLAVINSLPRTETHARLLLSEQAAKLGLTDQAIAEALRALEAAYSANDGQAVEVAAGSLGRLNLEKGWPERAADWFRQALEISTDNTSATAWLGNLGMAMHELGQFEEAQSYYSLALAKALDDGDLITQAICQGSLGNLHFEQGALDEAISCYDLALSLSLRAQDPRRAGIWLGNIGNTWLKKGAVDKAVELCQKAVDVARENRDQQAEAAHLDSLGDCLMAAGRAEEAKDAFNKALEISEKIADRQGERIYLSNMGRVFQVMGQLQPAFEFFERAIDLFDQQRSSIKSDDLKTSFGNRGQDLYRDMVKVCISMGKRVEALEYVGRAKSRALLDLLSNSPIDISELLTDGDEALSNLVAREAALRGKIAHLERLYWQGPTEGSGQYRGGNVAQNESSEIYREWRDVVSQLKKAHPGYASLISASTLNWREIAELWQAPQAR